MPFHIGTSLLGARIPFRCLSRVALSQRCDVLANSSIFRVSEEVREAVDAKRPVVALETTIYTHGWSYPDNLHLAAHLESTVRAHGGIPATIGVLEGVACVGMSSSELKSLVGRPGARKISRRDLGFATGLGFADKRTNGGTTVAGTMVLAHLAGIKVFATGGLGGVHKGGESSLDVSADLTELGRTPVAVIASGCKSFLDIGRTLEYLETQGVGVATFADGREGPIDFPAFWSRDSGSRSPFVVRDEVQAAGIIYAQLNLPLSSGLLFANPVPLEFSIPRKELENIIEQALKSAHQAKITGSANTPFVLNAIKDLSGGRSVTANRALIESNVIRGVKVAIELCKLEQEHTGYSDSARQSPHSPGGYQTVAGIVPPAKPTQSDTITAPSEITHIPDVSCSPGRVNLVVAGGLALDLSCDYSPLPTSQDQVKPQLHTSNPSLISASVGGVAHNVAKSAHLLGTSVRLCSAVGDDPSGRVVLDNLRIADLDTTSIKVSPGAKTAQYVCVNDMQKNLVVAMADMSIFENSADDFSLEMLESQIEQAKPKWLVVDANWNPTILRRWLTVGNAAGAQVAFEPVSTAKSARLFASEGTNPLAAFPNRQVDLATPNAMELAAMHTAARSAGLFERDDWWQVIDALGIPPTGARVELSMATTPALVDLGVPQQTIQLLPFIPCIVTKLGPQGVLLTQLLPDGDERLHSASTAPFILSRTKTGDNGVGGVYMRLFAPAEVVPEADIVSVNGVGDTFLGALMAGLTQVEAAKVEDLVDFAQRASVLSLRSKEAVHPKLWALSTMLKSI